MQQRAVIGSCDSAEPALKVDFLLQGLAVQPRHALLEVEAAGEEDRQPRLYVSPLADNAR